MRLSPRTRRAVEAVEIHVRTERRLQAEGRGHEKSSDGIEIVVLAAVFRVQEPAAVHDPGVEIHRVLGARLAGTEHLPKAPLRRRSDELQVVVSGNDDDSSTGSCKIVERAHDERVRVGDELELADMGEARLVVSKLGRSPLPHDRRPCAYLQALQSSAESGSLVDVWWTSEVLSS